MCVSAPFHSALREPPHAVAEKPRPAPSDAALLDFDAQQVLVDEELYRRYLILHHCPSKLREHPNADTAHHLR